MKIVKRLFAWDEHRSIQKTIGKLIRGLIPVKPIALDDPDAPDMTNWSEVEKHWGFTEEDRPRIIRGYQIEMLLALVPAFLAILIIWNQFTTFGQEWKGWFTVVGLFFLSCLIICSRWWRIWMMKNKKFQPLSMWLGVEDDEKYR